MPFPAQSFGITLPNSACAGGGDSSDNNGTVTAVTASRQYPSSWASRAALQLSTTAVRPSEGTLLSQHHARSRAQLWCSCSTPCSSRSHLPAKAELGQLTWARRSYLVPSPRMFPLLWTCTPHCGDILSTPTQGWHGNGEWPQPSHSSQPGASISSSGLPCTGLNCSVRFPSMGGAALCD